MTFNTGNAVGSVDPRDLYDNAENLDKLSIGLEMSYPDRRGVQRKSWAGLEQQFADFLASQGWESVFIQYADGAVVQRPTQLVEREGELYRVALQSLLPLTLTGDWVVDAPKLVAVGNQPLRDQLAGPDGAAMIGRGEGSVDSSLFNLESRADNLDQEINRARAGIRTETLQPMLVDMHFGAMLGVGLGDGESTGQVSTTVAAAVDGGQEVITVQSAGIFSVGQLIAYQGPSGDWYSAVVKGKAGNDITISPSIAESLSVGNTVATFYLNFSHPNDFGYSAIADYALRSVSRIESVAFAAKDAPSHWSVAGGGLLTPQTEVSYANPGGAGIQERGLLVQAGAPGDGAKSAKTPLPGGTYRVNLVINTPVRDAGYNGTTTISVIETTDTGVEYGIAQQTITSWGGIRSFNLDFTVRDGNRVHLLVVSDNAAAARFYLGCLRYIRIESKIVDLDRGRHVLLGDSYIANGTIFRRFTERLPNAEVLDASVAGDNTENLIARFGTDVAPLSPDYVWVMVGTNDFYQGVSAELFATRINILRTLIAGIGAQAIFFSNSVGDAFYVPTGEKLTLSRSYAINTEYLSSAPQYGLPRSQKFSVNALQVPAGVTVVAALSAGTTLSDAIIRYLAYTNTALEITVGYTGSLDVPSVENPVVITGGAVQKSRPMPRTDSIEKFVVIMARNPTAGKLALTLVADIDFVST